MPLGPTDAPASSGGTAVGRIVSKKIGRAEELEHAIPQKKQMKNGSNREYRSRRKNHRKTMNKLLGLGKKKNIHPHQYSRNTQIVLAKSNLQFRANQSNRKNTKRQSVFTKQKTQKTAAMNI